MNEIAIGVSLIRNELKTIKRNCKKLRCQVPDLLTPTNKWISELQEKKEHHLHKNIREARLPKVKSERSGTFNLVNFTGKMAHAPSFIQEDENGV